LWQKAWTLPILTCIISDRSVNQNDRSEEATSIRTVSNVKCQQQDKNLRFNNKENSAMENQDNYRNANAVANIIRVIGTLFFIGIGVGLWSWKYGAFAGIACFLIAPKIRQFIVTKS
jgi:hypothetical protein